MAGDAGVVGGVRWALGRAVDSRPRRWLLAITLGLGALAAAAVPADPGLRSFAGIAGPVQQLMSVPLPFLGVLLARDGARLARERDPGPLRAVLAAAVLYAAAVALAGALFTAAALALAPPGPVADPWRAAVAIGLAGVPGQVVAQLVGTGCGLLLRSPVAACAATLLPIGVWALLGLAAPLHGVRDLLTPYGQLLPLLDGTATARAWAMWPVMALLWAVGPNLVGAARGGWPRRG
ncbi:hypothetical protein GCM10010123_05180 [Pilimelia anulata]|uniref:Uncharacterized protein n=1 Tax=Pilimelia anulata TaxID=53371 RepID=A0A8J3F7F8_9ACTN|nr:hypothetical protein [Pilimelia anulata]GGJ78079.1 hypothetical protein GCM10010123_05180 [Pilimelia anulata]